MSRSVEEGGKAESGKVRRGHSLSAKMGKKDVEMDAQDGGGDISLSVEETNRLRAELGLGPLRVESEGSKRSVRATKQETESAKEARDRIERVKERRKATEGVFASKTLAEELAEEEEGNAEAWVVKMKKAQAERRKNAAVSKRQASARKAAKTREASDDAGMAAMEVSHSVDALGDEPVILTLADKSILDENQDGLNEEADELENAQLKEQERAKKNNALRKKDFRRQYNPAQQDENTGILSKYDEEKSEKAVIHADGSVRFNEDDEAQRRRQVREKLMQVQEELQQPDDGVKIATDYMTAEEVALFKKPKEKKRRKKVKKLRSKGAEETLIEELENEGKAADVTMETGPETVTPEERKARMDKLRQEELARRRTEVGDEADDDDVELREALARARRAMNREKGSMGLLKVQEDINEIKEDDNSRMDKANAGAVVLDETSEFVRNIRTQRSEDVRRYDGGAVGRDDDMQMEATNHESEKEDNSENENERGTDQPDQNGANDELVDSMGGFAAAKGIGAALEHFRMLGDLKETNEQVGRAKDERLDKKMLDAVGPRKDLKVKLEYTDEFGREMTQREAFRKLCYEFHGKYPSRKRREKALQSLVEAYKTKQRGSGPDTPLESVKALKQETMASGQAYVVISGAAALTGSAPGSGRPTKIAKDSVADSSEAAAHGTSTRETLTSLETQTEALVTNRPQKVAMTFSNPSAKRTKKEA